MQLRLSCNAACSVALLLCSFMCATPVAAQYDTYCRQSGNSSAQNFCVKAEETDWVYSGGSYPFTLHYGDEKSLEDVVSKLIAGMTANNGFWCGSPTVTPEGGWVTSPPETHVRWYQYHLLRTRGETAGGGCTGQPGSMVDSTYTVSADRYKNYYCPPGEQGPFQGPMGQRYCTRSVNQCVKSENPVAISNGHKLYSRIFDAPLLRRFHFYRSYLSVAEQNPFGLLNRPKPRIDPPILDEPTHRADVVGWRASYDATIWTSSNQAGTNTVMNVDIPGGGTASFLQTAQGFTSLQNAPETLLRTAQGGFFYRGADLRGWEFDAQHKLIAIFTSEGARIGLAYGANGQLQSADDSFGRSLVFHLGSDGAVQSISRPDGETYGFTVGGGVLRSVSFPPVGGVRHSTGYYYEYESAGQPALVTGEYDENARRFATFSYGPGNRVQATELHRGDGVMVNRHVFDYSGAPGEVRVEDPLGTVRAFTFGTYGGFKRLAGMSQPGGSGCEAASNSTIFGSDGLPLAIDAFDGTRACVFHDVPRGLEIVRLQGLARYTTCGGYNTPGITIPTGSRKVSTQWHPDWRLETRVAEPGRIVTSVYNGQPDPFNGNAVASCAPASALLPDGKPIAVLCKRVEQATTDTNGAAGFSAVLQPGVPARTTTWTYNQWGQVLTENGPRTDVNDTTTYTYYNDTSFTGEGAAATGHFMGDLATVTNAAGRVTQYTQYNKHGQVLESIDPNGVVTSNTYDLRQRLLSTTTAGRTTQYTYDPVGQLKRVTLPDQSWIGYDYDDAHRQVAVYDHKGNRVDYTLDNAGNRIAEQTKDPSGALKRQLARSIDALGRVQQTTGRE
jgi:YD repeat-containing protein